LDGEIFEPLKDINNFKKVRVNPDLDTIVWENGADMCPDFLYKVGVEVTQHALAV
jgi:ribosomal protein L31E